MGRFVKKDIAVSSSRHQTTIFKFEAKYRQNFETFRQQVLRSEPDFETEQDYFDWELAVTSMSDEPVIPPT